MRTPLVLLMPILLAAALSACATNPASGKKQAALMSEERELEIGRELDPEIRKQYGVYDSPELQAYVQRVGERLALLSHRSQLFYRFTVLDSPEVNAFALPGGYVYITRGLLAYLNSEAELAAVLGHEIGHVTARHAVRQHATATAANLGFTIGAIFVPELANQAVANLVGLMNTAIVRGYGRKYELEADHLGSQYLALGGYDPHAMVGVLELLKNQEGFELERARLEGREPRVYHGVLATHPSNDQRLQELIKESSQLVKETPRVGREDFLALINGMVFGDSVKQGVRHGSNFYHRDLGFAVSFPEGWRIENHPDKLIASSRDNEAKIVLRLEDLNRRLTPQQFMRERLKLKDPKDEARLEGTPLEGHTALTEMTWKFDADDRTRSLRTRVTVVFFRDKAYAFHATALTPAAFSANDPRFLDSARSFRALNAAEARLAAGLRIGVIETRPGDSFASLAKSSPVPNYPERILRLLNDKYPDGEPTPGSQIKVVR